MDSTVRLEMGPNFEQNCTAIERICRYFEGIDANANRCANERVVNCVPETFYDTTQSRVYFSVVALLANDAYWFSSRHFIRHHLYNIACIEIDTDE